MKNFVILNGLVIFAVVLYMMRRRPKAGATLNFKVKPKDLQGENLNDEPSQNRHEPPNSEPISNGEKELNVIYQYNGHDWDAYEVLGLPAGSSLDKVEEAYKAAIASVDEPSREFLKMAYQAICQKRR